MVPRVAAAPSVEFADAIPGDGDGPGGVAGISSDCAGTAPGLELSWLTSGLLVFAISRFESDSGRIGLVPGGRLRRDRVLPLDHTSRGETAGLFARPKSDRLRVKASPGLLRHDRAASRALNEQDRINSGITLNASIALVISPLPPWHGNRQSGMTATSNLAAKSFRAENAPPKPLMACSTSSPT